MLIKYCSDLENSNPRRPKPHPEQRCRKVRRNQSSGRMRHAGPGTPEAWGLLAIVRGAEGGSQDVGGQSLKHTVTNIRQITRMRFFWSSTVDLLLTFWK